MSVYGCAVVFRFHGVCVCAFVCVYMWEWIFVCGEGSVLVYMCVCVCMCVWWSSSVCVCVCLVELCVGWVGSVIYHPFQSYEIQIHFSSEKVTLDTTALYLTNVASFIIWRDFNDAKPFLLRQG